MFGGYSIAFLRGHMHVMQPIPSSDLRANYISAPQGSETQKCILSKRYLKFGDKEIIQ